MRLPLVGVGRKSELAKNRLIDPSARQAIRHAPRHTHRLAQKPTPPFPDRPLLYKREICWKTGFFTRKNPRQPTMCSRRFDIPLRHLCLRRRHPPKPKPSMLVPQTGRNAKEWPLL